MNYAVVRNLANLLTTILFLSRFYQGLSTSILVSNGLESSPNYLNQYELTVASLEPAVTAVTARSG